MSKPEPTLLSDQMYYDEGGGWDIGAGGDLRSRVVELETKRVPAGELPCDPKIFKKGVVIAISAIRPMFAEAWCAWVKRETGLVVDWSYMGGRNVFKTLGDPALAKKYLPMLDFIVKGENAVLGY